MEDKRSEHKKRELLGEFVGEPLLIENRSRFTTFPIQYHDIMEMYNKQESRFWTAKTMDFVGDNKDFEKLGKGGQDFLLSNLAFFSCFDSIISETVSNISEEFPIPEIRLCFNFQVMMEGIHNIVYNLMIDSYVKNKEEKNNLFNAIKTDPWIKRKAEWYIKNINKYNNTVQERTIVNAITEGVLFSSAFASIFWVKERGLMPGLSHANAEIAFDESLHCQFWCLIYSKFNNRVSVERVYEIFNEIINIENDFLMEKSLPVELIGMNSKLMIQYVKFCADRLLVELGYEKLYKVENSFEWMNRLNLDYKSNFFEKNISEYAKDDMIKNISFTEDF